MVLMLGIGTQSTQSIQTHACWKQTVHREDILGQCANKCWVVCAADFLTLMQDCTKGVCVEISALLRYTVQTSDYTIKTPLPLYFR